MIQNVLSSSINYPTNSHPANLTIVSGDSGGVQEIEGAGRLIDKNLNFDSCFPSLLDKLQVPPNCASVSGLSENDYPSGGDNRMLRHLHTLKKVPLPADLLHHFQHMQSNCMMGLFPEIKRAWLTIDSDIYVWIYDDGLDLAYFDGLNDTILSVGIVRPKPGVFKDFIEYLLCLTTPTEIVLLGVSFSYPTENEAASCMHLLPEPLFSVATDGAYILTIRGTKDGRIFMGSKDGSLLELVYQAEDGWFSRKCRKVNHSKSALSYIVPSFMFMSEEDPITQIEIDESRHIIYTLSEKGNISVYDLGQDGKLSSSVTSIYHNSLVNTALQYAKTIDKSNFRNFVSICPVMSSESPHIHLVIVTGTGVRLYYTTAALNNPLARPSQLCLLHVRLPPGFAANALTHRPTKVHKALHSNGLSILCASESPESDVIWSVSVDQYPYHPLLAESQAVMAVDGYVWALADVTPPLWCSSLNPPTPQGTTPPLLVTQHQQAPRQLVLLSASGAHILTALRPVDQLRQLLMDCSGCDSPSVREFFQSMSQVQACATALILAMGQNVQDIQVAEWARDALFRYGSSVPTSGLNHFQTIQSPAYNFQPTQMSTPVQGQNLNQSHVTSSQQTGDQQYSPLHNALYLFLARILRPVWATPLFKEVIVEGSSHLNSIVNADEVSFLSRKVELLGNFMHVNQGPGQNLQPSNANTSLHGLNYPNDGNVYERSSLLALRNLINHCLEVLRLWTVLTTHSFSQVMQGLSKEFCDQLRSLTLRDLVLSGKEVCRSLIMALMDRYHGDNASIDAISNRLREVCPNLYRTEDAKLSKANEIILAAKNNSNKIEKEKAFREAVELCKQIGQSVNVIGLCNQLSSGGCYEGIVDLCLSVAQQRDPNGQGLVYYNNKQPADDPQGYVAFNSRIECYRVIIDHLSQLVGSIPVSSPVTPHTVPNRPGPPLLQQDDKKKTQNTAEAADLAEQMIALLVKSGDELAHVTLYQWLIDSAKTDCLLSVTSPFLENYLTKGSGQGPINHLLWRYYERNKQYYKAAKTLVQMADHPGEASLITRMEYLSRALMCLSSSQVNTTTSYVDFMMHLEERKDVARLQLMILDAIKAKGGVGEATSALNSTLLNITTLYESYAEPWQLWECKLAIVHCAGHSEPQLVHSLWTNIIDHELTQSQSNPTNERINALSAKIKSLARLYSTSPNYFPLEHIVRTCEIRSIRMKNEATGWLVVSLHQCGIPVTKLITIYHSLYLSGDSIWEVERSPYHLIKCLSDLFNLLTDFPSGLSGQEKGLLRETCLDYVAAYLNDLGASADPSAALISAQLKACQTKLEKS